MACPFPARITAATQNPDPLAPPITCLGNGADCSRFAALSQRGLAPNRSRESLSGDAEGARAFNAIRAVSPPLHSLRPQFHANTAVSTTNPGRKAVSAGLSP